MLPNMGKRITKEAKRVGEVKHVFQMARIRCTFTKLEYSTENPAKIKEAIRRMIRIAMNS